MAEQRVVECERAFFEDKVNKLTEHGVWEVVPGTIGCGTVYRKASFAHTALPDGTAPVDIMWCVVKKVLV